MYLQYPFAKLIHPISVEEFFAEYWEKKELVVHRSDRNYYADLLTLEQANQAVTRERSYFDQIFMGNYHNKVDQSEYTFPSGLIDAARLYDNFAKGSSIGFNQLHERVESLANMVRSLEAEFSTRFQTNVYFTPADAQCFAPHYDTHCVFALQCHGKKNWRIYDVPVALPLHDQKYDSKRDKIGPVTREFTLDTGDFVYCPRGLGHDADTAGLSESSLHITLGVLQHNWSNFIADGLNQLIWSDPKIRAGLPMGFAREGFDKEKARKTFKEMLAHVAETMDFDGTFERFVEDIITTRYPLLDGQHDQVMTRLPTLNTVDRRAGARPSVLYRITEADEKTIRLEFYGRSLTLPAHVRPALKYALENADYLIAALPGDLDDPGKLVLIRRLVREGLVLLK